MLGGNASDLRYDILDLLDFDSSDALVLGLKPLISARFIDDIDGLVRHMTIIDVAGRKLCCSAERLIAVFDVVVLLESTLQPTQDANGVFNRWLGHIDLLEAPRQCTVLLEDAAKFLEGSRANASDLARRQQRLEKIGRVHYPARGRACTDNGVNFVYEQDSLRTLAKLVQQRLEALLEIPSIFCTSEQSPQIKRINDAVGEQLGHLVIYDTLGKALGNRSLTHTGLTNEQRIVLATASQNLRDPLDLMFTPNQRVDTALTRQIIQIACIGIEWISSCGRIAALLILHFPVAFRIAVVTRHLGNAMSDVIDDVNAGDILLLEQKHRLAFLLTENRNQHIGASDLTLARALNVEHRPLQYSLEA